MVDSDDTSANKDVPPWLQPVPEGENDTSLFSANRKTLIMAGAAVVLIAVFVGAIAFMYQDTPSDGPKRVAADAGPVKEKPTDAGGMKVDHQDKAVLEIGDGTKAKPRIEIGEQPEQPVTKIPDQTAGAADPEKKTTDAIGDIAEAATEGDEKPTPMPVRDQAVQDKAVEAVTPATPAPAPAQPMADGFRVQLGAYGSEATAATAWRGLKAKFPSQLGDLDPVYVSVQSGDRTLFRLRAGPIATRARADEICISLRFQDQGCFVAGP